MLGVRSACAPHTYEISNNNERRYKTENIYIYSEYHARPNCFRTMIDWVSIVRHSRRRFSDYMFTVPAKVRKRRRVKRHTNSTLSLPNDRDTNNTISRSKNNRSVCECCWNHVSSNANKRNALITRLEITFAFTFASLDQSERNRRSAAST